MYYVTCPFSYSKKSLEIVSTLLDTASLFENLQHIYLFICFKDYNYTSYQELSIIEKAVSKMEFFSFQTQIIVCYFSCPYRSLCKVWIFCFIWGLFFIVVMIISLVHHFMMFSLLTLGECLADLTTRWHQLTHDLPIIPCHHGHMVTSLTLSTSSGTFQFCVCLRYHNHVANHLVLFNPFEDALPYLVWNICFAIFFKYEEAILKCRMSN